MSLLDPNFSIFSSPDVYFDPMLVGDTNELCTPRIHGIESAL